MSNPIQVVISAPDDNQIPYVERHLDEPFLVLYTRDILDGKACTFSLQDGKVVVVQSGRTLDNVKSVWYRRLMLVQGFELPVAEGKQKYVQSAIRYFNHLLLSQFEDAFWVSDFFAVEKANDKLRQLQTAARIGFNVPDTLITANPAEAYDFVRRYKSVIAKPNYAARFQDNGKEYVFYTSRVDHSTDFSGLRLAPAILQEAVDIKVELRITVVGDKVFAASLESNPASNLPAHIRDWRVANLTDEVTIKPFTLPVRTQNMCIQLVRDLGLRFGAMDVIMDKRGKFWFLENNPTGQWGFIEDATGLPIGKAIANLLEHGKVA